MTKDNMQKKQNDDQEEKDTTTLLAPVSGDDGRTKSTKRKANPQHQSPAKRPRLSQEARTSSASQDEAKKVSRKRKRNEEKEEPSSTPKKKKGHLGLDLNDGASSSFNSESCSSNVESCSTSDDTKKVRRKKKAVRADEKTPRKKKGKKTAISAEGETEAEREEDSTVFLLGQVSGDGGGTKPTKVKATPQHQSPAKTSSPSVSQDEVKKVNRKRKRNEKEPLNAPKKRKGLLGLDRASSLEGCSSNTESCSTSEDTKKVPRKRKALGADEAPRKRKAKKKTLSAEEIAEAQKAELEAKYKEDEPLGEGGCGTVFAGYRIEDDLPVAIKHIPKDKVFCKYTDEDGRELSAEVVIMLKLREESTESGGKSAPVALLDWYELELELILVLERPVAAVDLFNYIEEHGSTLEEDKAKVILKQLVDAAIHLQENQIFHRDIKVENILIETDSDIPQVRLIDFGLSCFYSDDTEYDMFYGTEAHAPPEWINRYTYSPEPTTVWQMGVVLFETLHTASFKSTSFIRKTLKIKKLAKDCRDFLNKCFTKDPNKRPTLEDLRSHPWLT